MDFSASAQELSNQLQRTMSQASNTELFMGNEKDVTVNVKRESASGSSTNTTPDQIGPMITATPIVSKENEQPVLREIDCAEQLSYNFSTTKKWWILTVMSIVQISMNFNAAVFVNAMEPLHREMGVSEWQVRIAMAIFLITYGFGCELWAPWSEEWGRKWVLQASLGLVNVFQVMGIFAPNFKFILAARALTGLFTAGGSLTLGIVADMYTVHTHQQAVAFVVLWSVGGSVFGPIVGGFLEKYASWKWNFIAQLIFGVAVQLLHFFCCPETRNTVLMAKVAKKMRKAAAKEGGNKAHLNIKSEEELKPGLTFKKVTEIWIRPFHMFICEPIVLCLSLLSGFSDALIFTFFYSWGPVMKQWGFDSVQTGLSFIALLGSYVIAWLMYVVMIKQHDKKKARLNLKSLVPESRLWLLLFLAPLEAIGMFGFGWTSLGPPLTHWIGPILFSILVGIANYAIYMATIDYMVASYGPYAASATGGNGFARDILAGIAVFYAKPLFNDLADKNPFAWGCTLLGGLAILVIIPIYFFYKWGPSIRARSTFAKKLEAERVKQEEEFERKEAARGAPLTA